MFTSIHQLLYFALEKINKIPLTYLASENVPTTTTTKQGSLKTISKKADSLCD
jgi:hypothetical protein